MKSGTATREHVSTLARTYAVGRDPAVRAQLVSANLGLVVTIAKRFAGVAELSDLIGEGTLGLFEAAERFDPDRGTAFSTYAWRWVRKLVYAAVRASGPVRRSEHVERLILAEEAAIARLAQELGREPEPGEVDVALGHSASVAATSQAGRALRRRGDDRDIAQVRAEFEPDEKIDRDGHIIEIRRALDAVAPEGSTARRVFDGLAFNDADVDEVAAAENMARDRVQRIYQSVIGRLQTAVGAVEPSPQLDMFGGA